MSQPTRLIAGAMSGTSGDGVDVAVVRVDGRGQAMSVKLVKHHHVAYDPSLRASLFSIRQSSAAMPICDLARLAREVSLSYARAVNEALHAARLTSDELTAVAAHGQTLFHAPPST